MLSVFAVLLQISAALHTPEVGIGHAQQHGSPDLISDAFSHEVQMPSTSGSLLESSPGGHMRKERPLSAQITVDADGTITQDQHNDANEQIGAEEQSDAQVSELDMAHDDEDSEEENTDDGDADEESDGDVGAVSFLALNESAEASYPRNVPVFIRSHRNFNLKDSHGRLQLTRVASTWEKFTIVNAGRGKVFLKSHRKQYVQDNRGIAKTSRNRLSWEKWSIHSAGGGKVFLTSHRHQRIADHNGVLKFSRNKGWWEKWRIVRAVRATYRRRRSVNYRRRRSITHSRRRGGIRGPKGGRGPPGPPGKNGRSGTDGRNGQPGRDGQPGEKGRPGSRGPTGPKGDRGKAGAAGKASPAGKVGPIGPKGAAGKSAKVFPAQNCKWSSWLPWSDCSQTCGKTPGSKRRERAVAIYPQDGGRACSGLSVAVQDCGKKACPTTTTTTTTTEEKKKAKSGAQERNAGTSFSMLLGAVMAISLCLH